MENMNKELPTIYYVYKHVCPETGKLLYIGQGSKGRAWVYAQGTLRSKDHDKYLMSLTGKGFISLDWVQIIDKALTKEEAFLLETLLIWDSEEFPIFNSKRDYNCKLNKEDLIKIKSLREKGMSYESIGKEVGLSTMTVFRALTGKTKNYV